MVVYEHPVFDILGITENKRISRSGFLNWVTVLLFSSKNEIVWVNPAPLHRVVLHKHNVNTVHQMHALDCRAGPGSELPNISLIMLSWLYRSTLGQHADITQFSEEVWDGADVVVVAWLWHETLGHHVVQGGGSAHLCAVPMLTTLILTWTGFGPKLNNILLHLLDHINCLKLLNIGLLVLVVCAVYLVWMMDV